MFLNYCTQRVCQIRGQKNNLAGGVGGGGGGGGWCRGTLPKQRDC